MLKIRYLSDIHNDVNGDDFKLSGDVFTVLAGDISGNVDSAIEWVKKNVKQGVFVEGNHILYNSKYFLEDSYGKLREAFPLDADVSFLQNESKVVNGITFAGCTLWTDYNLYGHQSYYMARAERLMNDYRWRVKGVRKTTPERLLKEHVKSVNFLKQFENAVFVTHHAPSRKSISAYYGEDDANPCYASDLEELASRQKVWIHGHVHDCFDYYIGDCHVVCNPRGYIRRNESWDFSPEKEIEVE